MLIITVVMNGLVFPYQQILPVFARDVLDIGPELLGLLIAVVAAFVPLAQIVELVNVGTLFAFILVNIGVLILRRTEPDRERTFRVPFAPVTPLLGLAFCVYMMFSLGLDTWIAFIGWMVLGFVIYFGYSVRKARLAVPSDQ